MVSPARRGRADAHRDHGHAVKEERSRQLPRPPLGDAPTSMTNPPPSSRNHRAPCSGQTCPFVALGRFDHREYARLDRISKRGPGVDQLCQMRVILNDLRQAERQDSIGRFRNF